MMKRRLWIVTLVLVALLLPAGTAFADGGDDGGRVIFGGNFVLEEGDELAGGLVVFGGNATLEVDSVVDGDVLIMGGNLTVAGEIDGDVAVFGGNVELEDTAVVDGDLLSLGGNVTRAEGAMIEGETLETLEFPLRGFRLPEPWRWKFIVPPEPELPEMPELPQLPPRPGWPTVSRGVYWMQRLPDLLGYLFLRGLRVLGTALVLVLLSLLVLALWPRQTDLVASTVLQNPAASLGMGLLTLLVVLGLIALFAITICLSPLALLLALATAVAWLFGWIALGWLVGRRLLAALKAKDVAPVWEAGLGVFLITLLGAMPCIGWLVWLVGGAFGLGAVVLTRFGSQRYNGTQPAPPPEPPDVLPVGPILPEEDEVPEPPSVELPSPEDGEPAEALLSEPSLPEPPEEVSVEEVEPD